MIVGGVLLNVVRASIPVPSSAPRGTAAVGSALLSRNSRTMNPTMGRMISAKTNQSMPKAEP
jgi:hypothetical protein